MPGETEADVAGHLAHRLIREGVVPVELRVASDDRLGRYRRPTFKAAEIRKKATITAAGRRYGLCASVTRSVSFGPVDEAFRSCHTLSSMVGATCIYFSRPGEPVSEVFRRARRIFEKFEHPHEWTLDYQGDLIGYAPREMALMPDSSDAPPGRLGPPMEPQRRLGPIRGHRGHRRPGLRGRHRGPELAQVRGHREGLPDLPAGDPGKLTGEGAATGRLSGSS